MIGYVDSREFSSAVKRLRSFFEERGFIEVHPQSRLSILAACEDPRTLASIAYAGQVWPLPQTGQMWLEHELLKDKERERSPGYFCVTTSYRNEPRPVPGRHDLIFPMFEFELPGDMEALQKMESDMLEHLGFDRKLHVPKEYLELGAHYGVDELQAEHETAMANEYGPVIFLRHFPEETSPFWNMRRAGNLACKIDVIMHGIETVGSAERSCNPDEMRERFHTISDGMYADMLFAQFTKDRVEKELNEFLNLDFFPRCGGGIGITRLIRAMKLQNLL